ncbi:tyrosine-protein phosphatase non-receptor type 1 [Gadus morhua]|uniref:tyrosine-protein phosphatase non-receptor type 1 n=1 Tax=Gadus morhua TaxID=8049 RepID=UPI0011B49D56|nr:tyrosine-protein phosphatase non-receptor type 1-like [Gadus morhua]XP_030220897.1 tyrosine-protein phosphatase non-receptor type 1-like [Gadus morhua]XP_056444380.1 tyrosine-protein phosphatase non-receptor type 1-like [Gadus chalcogrammus]XP_056444386.1 tyrosine-protein phosphatase non-receptor type 1-like [Gadus chalcogrammus]XP_056444394.1 tyrosine-protein phosphatase non-receptor type 1-like [Gadus chalcogrammus]
MEEEFREIDQVGSWSAIYQEIRQQSSELPCKFARSPENKCRNRYRDVSPFDHSRILLQLGDNDYINASLICMEEAKRNYILTQGPLPNTCGHFWEMVWEQRTRGVVMLNRVIEKGSIKCAQYWPQIEERDAVFEDTSFRVSLISEDVKVYYTVRQLELENLVTQETREILHFHYTTWPDFGVPESPASFLNFLFKVRETGCLSAEHGPVVVHCSAGIGRSGTFCLVDTCLVLMSVRQDPTSVRIRDVLLEMRRCRMGLIQTADQLRFSYLAVIEGAKCIMGDDDRQDSSEELSNDEEDYPEFTPPPPPPRPGRDSRNDTIQPPFSAEYDELIAKSVHSLGTQQDPRLRRRTVGDPPPPPSPKEDEEDRPDGVEPQEHASRDVAPPRPEPQRRAEEPEEPGAVEGGVPGPGEKAPGPWSPVVVNLCLCTAFALSAYVCYRACYH